MNRRLLLGAGACFAAAAVLAVLASDVARWRTGVPADDVRYLAAPGDESLWTRDELVPFGTARALLGVDDDLEFRRAVRPLRVAGLGGGSVSDPAVQLLRNEARARLEDVAGRDADPARRSRALGLLGVLGASGAFTETQERAILLQGALKNLRRAIAIDPDNDEAKVNLELALQRGRGLQTTASTSGPNPRPGGTGTRGAGAGQPGSGY